MGDGEIRNKWIVTDLIFLQLASSCLMVAMILFLLLFVCAETLVTSVTSAHEKILMTMRAKDL